MRQPESTDRRSGTVLAALLAFALLIWIAGASLKALWFDELVTLYLGQLSPAALWNALLLGADPNPPLTHLFAHFNTALFGQNAFALRLPSLVVLLCAIIALWTMLRRRLTVSFAAAGVLFLMATRGFDYLYDGRSYALLLGFGTIALAAWDASRHTRHRALAITAMGLALALGLSANYYGALAFLPIAAGEFATRRIRIPVWITLALAATPLLVFRPILHAAQAAYLPHAWNRTSAGVLANSYIEIVEAICIPAVLLIAAALWKTRHNLPRSPFAIAVAVTALLPLFAYAISLAAAGIVSPRCTILLCSGIAIAAAWACSQLVPPRFAPALLTVLVLWIAARQIACDVLLHRQKSAFLAIVHALPQHKPVVISDSLAVLSLRWYSHRDDITFPIDFDAIHRYEPDDSGERNLWGGRSVFPVHILPYADLRSTDAYLLTAPNSWLTHSLTADGAHLTPLPRSADWNNLGGVFTPMAHQSTAPYLLTR